MQDGQDVYPLGPSSAVAAVDAQALVAYARCAEGSAVMLPLDADGSAARCGEGTAAMQMVALLQPLILKR